MKKTLLAMCALTLSLLSCEQKPSYVISGTIDSPDYEGCEVYLSLGGITNLESGQDTAIVKNGKYEFKGSVTEPLCSHILIVRDGGEDDYLATHLALENGHISVHSDADGWTVPSGTPLNDDYCRFMESIKDLENRIADYRRQSQDASMAPEAKEKMLRDWEKAQVEWMGKIYDATKANINNPAFWEKMSLSNCTLTEPVERLKELIADATPATLRSHVMVDLQERIATLEKTALGRMFIDLKMEDPKGNPVALSDYAGKGKYVLVDFWASWCGPCKAEMPNVIDAYKKFKDKGFEVVGISLDSDRDAWLKALGSWNMPWPQMSDLQAFKSPGATEYGVVGIPCTILIDKDGKVIARDIRGKELHERLAELMP